MSVDEERVPFLLEARKDTQGTIRALDFKVNVFLVVLTLLLANFGHLAAATRIVVNHFPALKYIAVLGVASWAASFYFAYCGLAGRFNPGERIEKNALRPSGTFFAAGRHTGIWSEAILGIPAASKASLEQYVVDLPATLTEINTDLSYEMLKLSYIRELKSARAQAALILGLITVTVATSFWIIGAFYDANTGISP